MPGQDSLSDRVSGAADAVSGKLDQHKYETGAEANKRSVCVLCTPLEVVWLIPVHATDLRDALSDCH